MNMDFAKLASGFLAQFRIRASIPLLLGVASMSLMLMSSHVQAAPGAEAATASAGPPMKPPSDLAATDSRWLYRSQGNDTVLVFIHGIFGDTVGTWTNDKGKTFFEYVKDSPVGSKVDMFAFGFASNYVKDGSANIVEAANSLSAKLQALDVMSYRNVVLVGHSMGGLVAMRALISNPDLRTKAPLVVFYATPAEGAEIANVASLFLSNQALKDMNWADRNTFLQGLLQDWSAMRPRPRISCGYEVLKTKSVKVVTWTSGTRICIDDPAAAPIGGSDHITIVKPDRAQHDSIIVMVNAINRFVLTDPEARLETPDFRQENGKYVYTLRGAKGQARIYNASRAKAHYYIKDISDESLYIVPEETPQLLEAYESKSVRINLLKDSNRSEYSFVIRSGLGEEKQVIVKVKPKEVAADRARTERNYLALLNTHLNEPAVSARLAQLPVSSVEAQRETAKVAYDFVSKNNPDLPVGARWVLAADTLSSTQFPDAAVVALREAEAASLKTAAAPAVQQLAGKVAVQAGAPVIFRNISTPAVSPMDKRAVFRMFDAKALEDSYKLSNQMKAIPSLRAQGLQIEGDLRLSGGDRDGALKAYLEAGAGDRSPGTQARIEALDPAKGFDVKNFNARDAMYFQLNQRPRSKSGTAYQ
jgi:pimeloyl-ACP methyl ester carboxylesterase